MEKKALSFKEFLGVMGIGRTLGLKLIKDGTVAHVRLGRRIIIPVAAVDRMLTTDGK